jgi:hypothetical protein
MTSDLGWLVISFRTFRTVESDKRIRLEFIETGSQMSSTIRLAPSMNRFDYTSQEITSLRNTLGVMVDYQSKLNEARGYSCSITNA